MSYQLTSANSISYPNDFDNAAWTLARVEVSSANAILAPDGTLTADLITETAVSSGGHFASQPMTVDAIGDVFAQECYFKEFSGDRGIRFVFGNTTLFGTAPRCNVYPSSGGTIGALSAGVSSAFVEDVGGGWYKATLISVPAIVTGTAESYPVYLIGSGDLINYLGDSNSGIYAWGADIRKVVDIDPDYDLKDEGKKIETVHRTRSGGQYRYKWGQFDRLKFKIEDLTSSQACTINSWWSENHPVRLFDLNNACVISGYITNATKPIDQYMKPYTDQFKGVIELEGY